MSLLIQTIQEYLKEQHPKWKATKSGDNAIHIERIIKTDKLCDILISTHSKSINVWEKVQPTLKYPKGYTHELEYYTEHTLLQQITKAISHLEHL